MDCPTLQTVREFPREQLPLDNETELLRRINALAISPTERRILAALRQQQQLANGADEFCVSRDDLAAEARCNPGSVSEACQRLQARGLLLITRTGRQSAFRPDWLAVFEGRTHPLASRSTTRQGSATYRNPLPLPAPNQLTLPFRAVQGGVEICFGVWRLLLTETGLQIHQTSGAEISLPADIGEPTTAREQPDISPISAVDRSQQPEIDPPAETATENRPTSARHRPSAVHDHGHELNAMNESKGKGEKTQDQSRADDVGSWELNIDPLELKTMAGVNRIFERYQTAGLIGPEDRDDFHQFVHACQRRSTGQSLVGEEPIRKSLPGFIRMSLVKGSWRRGIRDVDRQWYAAGLRQAEQARQLTATATH